MQRDIKRVKEWQTMDRRLKIVQTVWGDINLNEIQKEHLIKLDHYLQKEDRSKATVNHYNTLLKSLFNYSIKKKKFSGENPINEIKPYLVEDKRREYTPEELEKILAAVEKLENKARKNAYMQKYIKRVTLLLFYTGMRIGEVYQLK